MDNKVTMKNPDLQNDSIADLLRQIANGAGSLVREEFKLAKQEFKEKAQSLSSGVIIISIGAVFGLIALATIWAAFVIWITYFWPPEVAALVSGIGLAIVSAIMAIIGKRKL